jgi:hypothetical protein
MTSVACWGEVDGELAELGRLAKELEGVEKRGGERERVERRMRRGGVRWR